MSQDIETIALKRIDGTPANLGDFAGKVRLVVNVASKCGLTPQYEGLESLYRRYRERGFEILGFPANDFGAQEPGSNGEIADFCTTNFGVDFPMFEKIAVTGPDRHPLYDALVAAQPAATSASGSDFKAKLAGYGIKPKSDTDVLWNFEKFLVDRDGAIVARFAPDTAPDAPILVDAIERALG